MYPGKCEVDIDCEKEIKTGSKVVALINEMGTKWKCVTTVRVGYKLKKFWICFQDKIRILHQFSTNTAVL